MTAHLGECHECHAAFRRLQQVLMSVDDAAVAAPELPDGFERTVWARLEPSLQRRSGRMVLDACSPPSHLGWATAAMVIVSRRLLCGPDVAAGDAGLPPPRRRPPWPRPRTRCASGSCSSISAITSIDRSGCWWSWSARRAADAAGVASERERAEQLVSANRLYRETAAATGDASVVDLLDQLERVLVEVAASPSDRSAPEIADLRRRIESGSLLFKVRVVSSDLQERRKAAARQTGQRSSL